MPFTFTRRLDMFSLVFVVVLAVACLAGGLGSAMALDHPAKSNSTGPGQPSSGPGGAQYAHASVKEQTYGEGDLQYWLFEPADPKPASAPVVIFNHGWSAMNPNPYRAWINHIVRRGNIVIYPRYQGSFRTKPGAFSTNAIEATKTALQRLQKEEGHVIPQLDKIAVVGHSAGGMISAGMAARAASSGLPLIAAVMCVEPGRSWGPHMKPTDLDDISTMPASTLLLTVAGDRDTVVKDIDAKRIINESVHVPPQNKNYVLMLSDDHGSPALVANHFAPTAPAGDMGADIGGKLAGAMQASREAAGGGEEARPIREMIRQRIRQRMQQMRSDQDTSSPASDAASSDDSASQALGPLLDSASTKTMHSLNALDYYGTWKLFDALSDAAFYGKNRDFALGNTPNQRYMGKWSDGVAVKELVVQVGEAK